MNERPVRIAVSIKDRAAQQLVSNLFSTAGASIQVCDDAAAIIEAADDIQAIVLGLSAAPEKTFDALVVLRQKLAAIPIYVINDAAGERHAKRALRFGATQVVSQELLPRRVSHLLQPLASAKAPTKAPAPIPPNSPAPGWAGGKADPAYEIQSMDLGSWLSVPGNRRLLGMEEPDANGPTPNADPAHQRERPGSDQTPPAAAGEGLRVAASLDPELGAGEYSASDSLGDCPHVMRCRAQYETQSAAILEVHLQREKRLHELEHKLRERLQVDIKHELTQQITAEEAHVKDLIAAVQAQVRREIATAITHVYLMVIALICAIVLAGLGMAWRLGLW
ncbi:hypothetical protein [uncultured Thiodictyon sp.]|uniref:hypothetical protein n=1 Tax=uncultured Thiodictyon sp. TaxID=1846217 RepID=UPI0025F775EC|nr:hypothetical protein [uncultured Thiodictyon sp.]